MPNVPRKKMRKFGVDIWCPLFKRPCLDQCVLSVKQSICYPLELPYIGCYWQLKIWPRIPFSSETVVQRVLFFKPSMSITDEHCKYDSESLPERSTMRFIAIVTSAWKLVRDVRYNTRRWERGCLGWDPRGTFSTELLLAERGTANGEPHHAS